jgi:hypothetical protein
MATFMSTAVGTSTHITYKNGLGVSLLAILLQFETYTAYHKINLVLGMKHARDR